MKQHFLVKAKKLLSLGLVLIILFLIIHVPPSRLELKDARAKIDGFSSSNNSIFFVLELNFTSSFPILILLNAKLDWSIAGVSLASDVPLFKHVGGFWNTSRFEVATDTLTSAIGAALFSGNYESVFTITFNYYYTQTFTASTTIE